MELAKELVTHYGYLAIVGVLALGIIGLPIPDEVFMTSVGYLCSIHLLSYGWSIFFSFTGAILGMMISYVIGNKIGGPLIDRYGKWVGLKQSRMQKVNNWFNKFGSWTVVFGYFIPGIRHVVCYSCGISRMHKGRYVTFACIGAMLWSVIFVSIGHFIGRI